MGYNSPPGDEIAQLFEILRELGRRVSELERPTGTQVYDALAELRQLVEELPGQIDAALAVAVNTGTLTATGNINAGGIVTATGGIISADVKSRSLVVGYDSVYIDANNRMGLSPSARRFKQDIEPIDMEPSVIDQMAPVSFRLIGAVEELGDQAKVEAGFIAEDLEAIGLGQFVTRGSDGAPTGIAYERLTVPLVVAVKQLRADVAALQAGG